MLELIIDYREKKIISQLHLLEKEDKIKLTRANLNLGDIIYKLTSDETGVTTYEIIIERKEINDLVSSIKDKRYKEQKHRLISNISSNSHTTELIYLIEGSIDDIRNPRDIKMYHGSLISMLLRDNIKLVFMQDINETCLLLERLYSRLLNKPHDFNLIPIIKKENINTNITESTTKIIDIQTSNRSCNNEYLNSRVKKKKSDNITVDNCGMLMLTYLPNISLHMATELLAHFNNKISELLAFVVNEDINEKDKVKQLATKRIKTISGKERNFGPANAKTIIEYLK
jgi:ERCC4-type nuclease